MCMPYGGAVAMGGVIALCLLAETVQLERIVFKPVVPKFCHNLCDETFGQSGCIYMSWDLSCHYITHKTVPQSSAKRRQFLKTAKHIAKRYAENNMRCPNDMKGNHIQGGRRAEILYRGRKKKSCMKKQCPASQSSMTQSKDCILFRRENVTTVSEKQLIALPLAAKPGMKVHVSGGFINGTTYAQLTFTKDAENPANILKWMHVTPRWTRKRIVIAGGLVSTEHKGRFPISDPSHFNVTLKLSSSSTKIYVDQTLVWTMKSIPVIKEFYIRRYGKVYRLVVQKTEDGCDEVDNGIP